MRADERSIDPWERRDGETARAYQAFRQYRDLGPVRSQSAIIGASKAAISSWSAQHRWPERAAAWDAEVYRLEDARRLDAIREMDQTHRQVARALITRGLEALRDPVKLTPHQAARMLDLGTRLERAALTGEHLAAPTGPVAVDDELSPLERIARELAGTA